MPNSRRQALVGDPVPRFEQPLEKCSDDAKNDIADTIDALRPHWNLLVPMKRPREEAAEAAAEAAAAAAEAAMAQDKEGDLDNRLLNMSLAGVPLAPEPYPSYCSFSLTFSAPFPASLVWHTALSRASPVVG